MPTVNLGNVVGLLKQVAPPAKTYVIWSKILNPSFPNIVELHIYNGDTAQWEPLQDGDGHRYIEFAVGAPDVYAGTPGFSISAYTKGISFPCVFDTINTGTITVNVSGIGAIAVKKHNGAGTLVDLIAGDIRANIAYTLVYDGTQFQLLAGVGGGGGGATIYVSDTYANISGFKTGGTLIPGATYFVNDRDVVLTAIANDKLSLEGSYIATNADWQNVGDYSAVTAIANQGLYQNTYTVPYTGLTGAFQLGEQIDDITTGAVGIITADTGSQLTVVEVRGAINNGNALSGAVSGATATANVPVQDIAHAVDEIVIWNNVHYVNTTGSHGADTPDNDGTNWTLLALATPGNGYISETDFCEFNFDDDFLQRRTDKRGNDIMYSFTLFTLLALTTNPLFEFKWGSDNALLNIMDEGQLDNRNKLGKYIGLKGFRNSKIIPKYMSATSEMQVSDFAPNTEVTGNILVGTSFMLFNSLSSSSVIKDNFMDGGAINSNTLSTTASISGNIGFNTPSISGNDLGTNADISTNTLDDGKIENNEMHTTSSINTNIFNTDDRIRECVLKPGARVENNTFGGTLSGLIECELENSLLFKNKTFASSVAYTRIKLGITTTSVLTINTSLADKRAVPGFSNLPWTLDVTGLTTIPLANLELYGIITLSTTNPNEVFAGITDFPVSHPVTFKTESTKELKFTHTDLGSATSTSIAIRQGADISIEGRANESDSITFFYENGSRIKEITHTILDVDYAMQVNENGEVGIGTAPVASQPLTVTELFATVAKHFEALNPLKKGWKIVYTSFEGPTASVFDHGRLTGKGVIELRPEWEWLVDNQNITVVLTPTQSGQALITDGVVRDGKIYVANSNGTEVHAMYYLTANRKDIRQPMVDQKIKRASE